MPATGNAPEQPVNRGRIRDGSLACQIETYCAPRPGK
ncbi:hypothetical protein J2T47_002206 [Pseudomonas nitroreducens]|nr:hypothetical protein [Pseudomonas nitroreducens]